MDLSARLKSAREAIGYTQAKAAAASNIGESSISDFENSKREPKFSQLSQLAKVYRKTIEFFLAEDLPIENTMLWRSKPGAEETGKEVEAMFRQLCQWYHNLEACTGELRTAEFEKPQATNSTDFSYRQAESLAYKTHERLNLGNSPSDTLKRRLEENWYIKIFYREFEGSAISTVSNEFGPAILLNKKNKLWRRNYDLAHELFHILTWQLFHANDRSCNEPSPQEESFANVFASALLLPADPLRERINFYSDENSELSFGALDNIVREFGVSWDALFWRLHGLYNNSEVETKRHIEQAKSLTTSLPSRESDEPDKLPERYCHLAIRALREGNISLMQFKKYMGISYRKAQEYLTEKDSFTDEKISISIS